jgi:hypothetical protein
MVVKLIKLSKLVNQLKSLNGWTLNKALYEVVRGFGLDRDETKRLIKLI